MVGHARRVDAPDGDEAPVAEVDTAAAAGGVRRCGQGVGGGATGGSAGVSKQASARTAGYMSDTRFAPQTNRYEEQARQGNHVEGALVRPLPDVPATESGVCVHTACDQRNNTSAVCCCGGYPQSRLRRDHEEHKDEEDGFCPLDGVPTRRVCVVDAMLCTASSRLVQGYHRCLSVPPYPCPSAACAAGGTRGSRKEA